VSDPCVPVPDGGDARAARRSAVLWDFITLFPAMFDPLLQFGVNARARENGAWSARCWNPRDFTTDVHRTVDDRPFGGGPGMVLMAEPLALAVAAAREAQRSAGALATRVISFSAGGRPLRDARVRELADEGLAGTGFILVCGRYEGIDQRFLDQCVDEEVSIGDFVLSGGEIAAMALVDAVARLLPGTIKAESAQDESFASGLLDAPHYTRPERWRGRDVPSVLLSGHHERIRRWRHEQAMARTLQERPDLLHNAGLSVSTPSSGAVHGRAGPPAATKNDPPMPPAKMVPGEQS
jgi:tRNA (guanine37-N1)-methyltransferase